jgi:hypothetical protein
VLEAHAAYVRAGCSVLTTNSFAATAHTLGSKVQRSADVASIVAVSWRVRRRRQAGAHSGVTVCHRCLLCPTHALPFHYSMPLAWPARPPQQHHPGSRCWWRGRCRRCRRGARA